MNFTGGRGHDHGLRVTHEMGFAAEVADRVLIMDQGQGQVLERAMPQDFFNRPQHPCAQQLMSDIRSPFTPQLENG